MTDTHKIIDPDALVGYLVQSFNRGLIEPHTKKLEADLRGAIELATISKSVQKMKTLCLTLRETPEREAACRKHFAERGIDATFIYGIHAGKAGLLTKNTYDVDNPGSGYTIGAHGVGIWMSFISMFQIALQMSDTHFLFLEHDAEFDANWKQRFDQGMKDVPPDFDFFFIGSCCLGSDKRKQHINGDVWRVSSPMCNHACVVSKKCLPLVIETLSKKCWAPLDIQLVREVFPHLKVFALLPRAVKQFDTYLHE